MSNIRTSLPPPPTDVQPHAPARGGDDDVRQLIKDITKGIQREADLRKVDVQSLSGEGKNALGQMLADQLQGQIPAKLATLLANGQADATLLGAMAQRLANAMSDSPADRAGKAANPEAARNAAANPEIPHQALRWAQFVQKTTNVGGSGVQSHAGSAAPKSEGSVLAELIANKLAGREGPGLRNPKLVERGIKDMSPEQRGALMGAVFGKSLAAKLTSLGIGDPLMFVKAGALPTDRAALAEALGIPRGKLLGLLMRAELLKVGTGRNGELGIRPEFLGPLKDAGIATMATLSALRGFSPTELKLVYDMLRAASGGFKNAVRGGRVPVKRDLQHWAKNAARKKSDILLADSEEYQGGRGMSREDAQELVQAWYLENLLWDALEDAKRRKKREQEEAQQDGRDRRRREEDEANEERRESDDAPDWMDDDLVPDLESDEEREDRLVCFWIVDHVEEGGISQRRKMYVCVDPESGAIIPQYIEKEGGHA